MININRELEFIANNKKYFGIIDIIRSLLGLGKISLEVKFGLPFPFINLK